MTTNTMFHLSPAEKISKARLRLYQKAPYFSYQVQYLKFSVNDNFSIDKAGNKIWQVPTICINARGNVQYNTEHIESKEYKYMEGTLIHEVMHMVLDHPQRCKNRSIVISFTDKKTKEKQYYTLWNIACDIVVNNIVIANGYNLEKGCILPEDNKIKIFGSEIVDISKKCVEEIYDELKKLSKDMEKDENSNPMAGGEFGKPIDEHNWKDAGKPSDAKEKPIDWKKISAEAMAHAKQRGLIPLGMEREIGEIRKSRIDWRTFLRKMVAQSLPFDLTWSRPARKYISQDLYLPSSYGESISVMIAYDTSGSMSAEDMAMGISESIGISRAYNNVEFRILTHDTEIHDDLLIANGNIKKIRQLKPKGGGGTDSHCIFEHIKKKEYNRKTKLLICFTDGYTSWPEKPVRDYQTLCVLVGNHCPKKDVPDWMTTICLE